MKNLFLPALLVIASLLSVSFLDVSIYAAGGKDTAPVPSFLLKGKGRFTLDGRAYKPFSFDISCSKDGTCPESAMTIGDSTIYVTSVYHSSADGEGTISLGSDHLRCTVFDLGQAIDGEGVVFDCLKPYGSGISMNATLYGFGPR